MAEQVESYKEQITRELATGAIPPSSALQILSQLSRQQLAELDHQWFQFREEHMAEGRDEKEPHR